MSPFFVQEMNYTFFLGLCIPADTKAFQLLFLLRKTLAFTGQ